MHNDENSTSRHEAERLSYAEICLRCDLTAEVLSEMIEYGVIEPLFLTSKEETIYFALNSIKRVNIAKRLCRDLEVNMAGAALAIELLDEIKSLRKNLYHS
jgi:chaperone modulatory protein CbpM